MSDLIERLRNGDVSGRLYNEAADQLEAQQAEIARLREALTGIIDDEPCWKDHHGYCQTHGLNDPCEMDVARAALEQKQ